MAGAGLKAEGEILRFAAHPGVVEVIRSQASGEGWELVLRRVRGSDLRGQPPWSAEEVAGFGAAAATILADLHDLGVIHGRLGPEHVLHDESGRPVLCGFGHARRCLGDPAGEDRKADDVADLARCLAARLPAGAPRAVQRTLDRATGGRRQRPVTARQLARNLGRSVAGAALPASATLGRAGGGVGVGGMDAGGAGDGGVTAGAEGAGGVGAGGEATPAGQRESGCRRAVRGSALQAEVVVGVDHASREAGARARRRTVVPAIVGVLLVGLAGALLLVTASPHSSRPASPASVRSVRGATTATDCPVADDGCGPVATQRDILIRAGRRYRIGEVGDVVVLGRWTCSPVAFPALLRPANGQVWAFDQWAGPGRDSTASLLSRVIGARSLRVLPGRDGCDRVEVLRRHGPPVILSGSAPKHRAGGTGRGGGHR